MTKRPTTLQESDQLAQAAANLLRNEDFVPKGTRWPFSRTSRAHREYEKAVQQITARRREAREKGVNQQTKKERANADQVFEQAVGRAQAEHAKAIAEAKRPHDAVELEARAVRDAAIAAAKLAYEKAMEGADDILLRAAEAIDDERDARVAEATAAQEVAYAAIETGRSAALAQIALDLKTVALEGPMRIVEERQAWSAAERRKALVGIVDMVGQDEVDAECAELCLRSVTRYVFEDRYLPSEAGQHRLMDVGLLEALVDLARRTPQRRPLIVASLHAIVKQNPGFTSAAFIKTLTELYVAASTDTATVYREDPAENDAVFDGMRERIADVLKLTPRRNQVSTAQAGSAAAHEAEKLDFEAEHAVKDPESITQNTSEDESATPDAEAAAYAHRDMDDQEPEEEETTRKVLSQDLEVTANLDLLDLSPEEIADGLHFGPDTEDAEPLPASAEPPPSLRPAARRGRRAHFPESDA
jgi:hypothetical protein